jgi:glycosyltransferase involved in cell wall biosynthesis
MILTLLACYAVAVALLNAALLLRNVQLYAPPPSVFETGSVPAVSVLIPARNEEASIRAAVERALASRGIDLEVVVLDDHSDDRTTSIVRSLCAQDSRLRLEYAPQLPAGWCGKQFACSVLAGLASHEILCFIDSDVRLQPNGVRRMVAFLKKSDASLVSGFPHQEVRTFFERLLLPLMHFLLLGFLPMDLMRRYRSPSLGAGCGQIFVSRGADYWKSGGHAAVRASRHDGIALPKAFRRAGFKTDLCDATDVAECRMYRNRAEVLQGLLKNANEGIAAPIRIFVFTALLFGGHVLPELIVLYCLFYQNFGPAILFSSAGCLLSLLPRLISARRFRQPVVEAFMHPFAILVFLGLQWYARGRHIAGVPATWKGRAYQET